MPWMLIVLVKSWNAGSSCNVNINLAVWRGPVHHGDCNWVYPQHGPTSGVGHLLVGVWSAASMIELKSTTSSLEMCVTDICDYTEVLACLILIMIHASCSCSIQAAAGCDWAHP